MRPTVQAIDHRRRQLIRALTAGLFITGSERLAAELFGRVPKPLAPGRSFYRLEGEVRVNGRQASPATPVASGDQITTGSDGHAIVVVGQDAMLLRANSALTLEGRDSRVVELLRLLKGGLLAVFGRSEHRVETPIATIGIRGTGLYAESREQSGYLCTCYGTTEIAASGSDQVIERITSRHHDQPRQLAIDPQGQLTATPAPVRDHTDLELIILEALTGRVPPFEVAGSGGYSRPRRRY